MPMTAILVYMHLTLPFRPARVATPSGDIPGHWLRGWATRSKAHVLTDVPS
jgi:hypothetical protein